MHNPRLLRLIRAALLAALCCVATMVIQIPTPMNGYVNLGDCFVLLSGWMLGPLWGFLAGGVGSMLADLFTGYAHYALGTFLIKGAMALLAALLFSALHKALRHSLPARILTSAVCEAVMVGGYFLYACLLLGRGLAAAASVPGNLVQGVFGAVAGVLLVSALSRSGLLSRLTAAR